MNRALPLLCLCVLFQDDAVATAPLSRAALHDLCRSYLEAPAGEDGRACASYVQGYLDGLRSGAVLESRPSDRHESWSERVARTRLSRSQLAGTHRIRYCLPDTVLLRTIVSQLVAVLDAKGGAVDAPASAALSETLRRHYVCKS